MGHRPYPNADRARRQIERHVDEHHPLAETLPPIIAGAELTAMFERVRQALRQITLPRATTTLLLMSRRGGRTAAMRQTIAEALARGEHVHSVSADSGARCHGGRPDCATPRAQEVP